MKEAIVNGLKGFLGFQKDSKLDFAWDPGMEAWAVFLIVVAAAVGAWFLYRIELNRRSRGMVLLMGFLRLSILLLLFVLLLGPTFFENTFAKRNSVVIMLVDVSSSMRKSDRHPAKIEKKIRKAAGLEPRKGTDEEEAPLEASRIDLVARVLRKDNFRLLTELEKKGDLVWVTFSSDIKDKVNIRKMLEAKGTLDDKGKPKETGIAATGWSTDIGSALQMVMDKYRSQKIQAIVLVTDGQHNSPSDWKAAADRAVRNKIPIYAVAVGDERLQKDVSVTAIIASRVAPIKSSLTIKALVDLSKIEDGSRVRAILLRATARPDNTTPDPDEFKAAAKPIVKIVGEDERDRNASAKPKKGSLEKPKRITFEFNKVIPEKEGAFIYRVQVELLGEVSNREIKEENAKNNRLDHTILIKDDRIKVLFVDQRPRYEYRYLRSVLVRQTELIVAWTYLLEADKEFAQDHTEGKYTDKRGKAHKIRPLKELPYRKATVEEEKAGIPSLEDFDVVILGDVAPRQFSAHRARRGVEPRGFLEDVKDFVEKGGGTLIMIAGERNSPSLYTKSPLKDVLPIEIKPVPPGVRTRWSRLTKLQNLMLTVDGKSNDITRLKPDENENKAFWDGFEEQNGKKKLIKDFYKKLPGFYWFYPVERTKVGAEVLVRHATEKPKGVDKKNYPLIVTGQYGAGKTMFIALDSLWRWRYGVGDKYYQRFWNQALQKLSGSRFLKGKRLTLELSPTTIPLGESLKVKVTILDPKLHPLSGKLTIRYQRRDKPGSKTVTLKRKGAKGSVYEKVLSPQEIDQIGDYAIWVELEDAGAENKRIGRRNFAVLSTSVENRDPSMNLVLLESIAKQTESAGGQFLRLYEMDEIPFHLKKTTQTVPVDRRPIRPHTRQTLAILALILALLLLTVEWILRKREKLV